jgi:hypothetical protein
MNTYTIESFFENYKELIPSVIEKGRILRLGYNEENGTFTCQAAFDKLVPFDSTVEFEMKMRAALGAGKFILQLKYTPDMLGELEPAYAITVHKAQGSEYRAVILAVCEGAPMLLTRGVLYTAITRARELLILVGDEDVVAHMTANDRQQRRYSGLRWRLAQLANG